MFSVENRRTTVFNQLLMNYEPDLSFILHIRASEYFFFNFAVSLSMLL